MATRSSVLALGSPVDGGTWRATVYGVAKSQMQLKQPGICAQMPSWPPLPACGPAPPPIGSGAHSLRF